MFQIFRLYGNDGYRRCSNQNIIWTCIFSFHEIHLCGLWAWVSLDRFFENSSSFCVLDISDVGFTWDRLTPGVNLWLPACPPLPRVAAGSTCPRICRPTPRHHSQPWSHQITGTPPPPLGLTLPWEGGLAALRNHTQLLVVVWVHIGIIGEQQHQMKNC